MKKAITAFVKFVIIAVVVTVIIGGIAIRAISDLAAENFALREQIVELENQAQQSQTMTCDLHVELLPSWEIGFLCYQIPMEFPTTWDYYNSYSSGEIIPMLKFQDNYFISIYVTA